MRALTEPEAKRRLTAYGIAVPRGVLIGRDEDPAPALAALRGPFALKLVSPAILHKSDVGGVALRLTDAAAVRAARNAMLSAPGIAGHPIEGFLVEEMAPPGHELVIGGTNDAKFGPVIMLGLGGIFVEVFADVAFRLCPIRPREAREMLTELRSLPVLRGARGGVVANEAAILEVLLRIGGEQGLLTHGTDIAELDINPLIVSATGAVAADARILLRQEAPA